MAAMDFIQRLAALMPQPRLHLIRFHVLLAPAVRVDLFEAA